MSLSKYYLLIVVLLGFSQVSYAQFTITPFVGWSYNNVTFSDQINRCRIRQDGYPLFL